MKVLDPGHRYLVHILDGGEPQELTFVKREGPGYPGNVGHHGGTIMQEVLRCVIERTQYLDKQERHPANVVALSRARGMINAFESRAAERSGRRWIGGPLVELLEFCPLCGHIGCAGLSCGSEKGRGR